MKTLNLFKNKKGFSLMETIIYLGIFSTLLVVLTTIFTTSLDSQLEVESASSVEQDGRFLLARLSYDIHQAQSIQTPSSLGASSGTLQMTVNGVTYTYSLVNGNVVLTNNLGTNTLNNTSTTISNLSFTKLGNAGGKDTITASFTIKSKVKKKGIQDQKTFSSTIGLR